MIKKGQPINICPFGQNLMQLMKEQDLSQRMLADVAGISKASVSRYIHGSRFPRHKTMEKLATTLQVTPDQLCKSTGKQNS